LSVARGDNYQVWWAADAFGLIWKKEETLELIRKENGSEDLAKQRISNRPLAVDSGTLLRLKLSPTVFCEILGTVSEGWFWRVLAAGSVPPIYTKGDTLAYL
jgi:hypothetical protein